MPIHGLTDRPAAFPRIGILRKGGAKVDEKRPGKDLTYFRFDSDDQEALARFTQVYGDEPRQIAVFLPYATVEENFQTWREEWLAGGLIHRCDGQTMTLWRNQQGSYSHDPRPCPHIGKEKPLCKPVGRLMVIIPELRRLAYVVALTTSINDIIELQQNLEAALLLRGDLRGIPFVLSRRPREISTPTKEGGRARREKWLLSIEPAPSWVGLQLSAMQHAALPAAGAIKALPDHRFVNQETGEILEADIEEDDEEPTAAPLVPTPSPVVSKAPPVRQQARKSSAPVAAVQDQPSEHRAVEILKRMHRLEYDLGIATPAAEIAFDDQDLEQVMSFGASAKVRVLKYIFDSPGYNGNSEFKNLNQLIEAAKAAQVNYESAAEEAVGEAAAPPGVVEEVDIPELFPVKKAA